MGHNPFSSIQFRIPCSTTFEILLNITLSKSQHPKTEPISYPPLNPLQGGDFTNPIPGGVPPRDLNRGGVGHIPFSSIQFRIPCSTPQDLLDIPVSKSQRPNTEPLQSILSFLISYPPLNPLQGGDFTNPIPGGVPRCDLSRGVHAIRDLLDITVEIIL